MVPILEWFIADYASGTRAWRKPPGSGEIQLLSVIKGKKILLTLTNVLYVPSFQVSLISVHQLAKNGNITSIFGQTGGHALDPDGNTVLEVTHDAGLYHIAAEPVVQSEHAHAAVDINILHRRMAHVGMC
ncbi:hypothetical protein C8R46DRAFT_885266 [Mycena filopes]|nr:hypothetical protein C8R46DRAFT_885266 [Mycena filopes]